MTTVFRYLQPSAVLLVVLLATACASDPARIPAGTTRADALQQLGTPTAVYKTREGERLQYSRAPMGFEVNNIDLDSTGRVVSVRQELNEGRFGRTIQPGIWREADILQTYGRPLEITRVTSFDGVVWTWRYKHINARRLLYIYVDPTGMVSHYNVGDDLMGEPDQRS